LLLPPQVERLHLEVLRGIRDMEFVTLLVFFEKKNEYCHFLRPSNVDDDGERATFGLRFAAVKDLLAFAKARQKTKTDNK
jgi:hypothetical protein